MKPFITGCRQYKPYQKVCSRVWTCGSFYYYVLCFLSKQPRSTIQAAFWGWSTYRQIKKGEYIVVWGSSKDFKCHQMPACLLLKYSTLVESTTTVCWLYFVPLVFARHAACWDVTRRHKGNVHGRRTEATSEIGECLGRVVPTIDNKTEIRSFRFYYSVDSEIFSQPKDSCF